MDKFALVYEFNTNSPLITYKASKELEAKNYPKAVELLALAIERYPNHSTPYFIYAEALAHENRFNEAKEMVSKGDDLLGEESTSKYYLNLIDRIKRKSEGISTNFDETVNEVLTESFIEHEDFESSGEIDMLEENIDQTNNGTQTELNQNTIVTETLAEIYASQNNYEEALQIFEKLKVTRPELKNKFDNRIAEIKLAINFKKQKKIDT